MGGRKNSYENGQKATKQDVESHVDSLINARHKRKRKMQWTREGAHNILQIRAKMANGKWSGEWADTVLTALKGKV